MAGKYIHERPIILWILCKHIHNNSDVQKNVIFKEINVQWFCKKVFTYSQPQKYKCDILIKFFIENKYYTLYVCFFILSQYSRYTDLHSFELRLTDLTSDLPNDI